MTVDAFPAKLTLAMKALSLSRGGLAAELRIDKSVVGRWATGVNAPTDHNLAALSTLIGARRTGFSALDWDRDLTAFRRALGLADADDAPGAAPTGGGFADWIPARVLHEAALTTAARGYAYEGFWRSTRPWNDQPGRFVHDRVMIRRSGAGVLNFWLTVSGMRFQGVALPTGNQVFAQCADPSSGMFIFLIFNAVPRQRADVLDGLSLTVQLSAGGSPVAAPVLLERTGMLSGDAAADDARHAAASALSHLAPEGSVPARVAAHLHRDVGPKAYAAGGDFLLKMPFTASLSRGPEPDVNFPE